MGTVNKKISLPEKKKKKKSPQLYSQVAQNEYAILSEWPTYSWCCLGTLWARWWCITMFSVDTMCWEIQVWEIYLWLQTFWIIMEVYTRKISLARTVFWFRFWCILFNILLPFETIGSYWILAFDVHPNNKKTKIDIITIVQLKHI